VAEVAEGLGLSTDELADRLVPDLGLDPDGSMTLDYGPRQFRVGFDEHLRPFVRDASGKSLKNLPKPGAHDDDAVAPDAWKRFSALKKEVKAVAGDQINRLEQAMVDQRRWAADDFERFFVAHPFVWHVARRLVWATYDRHGVPGTAFRVAEDRTLATVDDEAFSLDDADRVGVAHPVALDVDLKAWSEVFADTRSSNRSRS
jgi:hypothetical protein